MLAFHDDWGSGIDQAVMATVNRILRASRHAFDKRGITFNTALTCFRIDAMKSGAHVLPPCMGNDNPVYINDSIGDPDDLAKTLHELLQFPDINKIGILDAANRGHGLWQFLKIYFYQTAGRECKRYLTRHIVNMPYYLGHLSQHLLTQRLGRFALGAKLIRRLLIHCQPV